ncbi:MAG: MFS transporter [Gammaproteobacteria bacterium]|nr:MFS transporter [Gammaproteobacteria bacterium]
MTTNNQTKQSGFFYGWVNVGTAGVGHLMGVSTLVFFTFGIFLTALQNEFAWSRTSISAALIFATLTSMVMQPVAGYWSDRVGPKRVILCSIVGFNLVFASLYFLTPNLWHLYIVFALLTATGAGTSPITYCKVITEWFTARRGIALSLSLLGVGIGGGLMPELATHYVQTYGWRVAYAALALTSFAISFPIISLLLVNTPKQKNLIAYGQDVNKTVDSENYGLTPKEARRNKNFWLMIATFFLAGVSLNGLMLHLVPMLTDKGVTPQAAAGMAAVLGLSVSVGRLVLGACMDKFFAPRVALTFMSVPIIGILLFMFAPIGPLTYLAAACIGFAIGGEIDIVAYFVGRYFGVKAYSQIYGYIFAAFSVGSGVGPVLMGIAYDTTHNYNNALMGFVAALVVCCILLSRISAYPNWQLSK